MNAANGETNEPTTPIKEPGENSKYEYVQVQALTILYSLNPAFHHEPIEYLSLLTFRRVHVSTRDFRKDCTFPIVLVSDSTCKDGLV